MKFRIFTALLIAMLMMTLFTGCSQTTEPNNSLEAPSADLQRVADSNRQINEESAKIFTMDPNAPVEIIPDESIPLAAAPVDGSLTKRDAESIAVHHAGFDPDQISFLYTKSKVDEEIPHYVVTFQESGVPYEFMVHAETGEILPD